MRHVRANRPWNLLVNIVAASSLVSVERRCQAYRLGGIDLNGTTLRSGCRFESDRVLFGPDGMVNEGCYFENREPIDVGARCYLGPHVMLVTSTHVLGVEEQRAGEYAGRAVTIGDGCWLGARVTVLPGVTVGAGCVIAAGAMVVRDCPPNGLYGGVPARQLRDLVD
jgi:maltose O-acetyltransferase